MVCKPVRSLVAFFCFVACSASVVASELSDCMQLFFDGDFQNANVRLTQIIDQGQQDARLFYFRGLAQSHLGNAEAAIRDFQRGATIEASGASDGVGLALQRVQGNERLVLEKYRTMARLLARRRNQPVAPKPIVSLAPNAVRLATAETREIAPSFRLSSEIPIRTLANDPFLDDTEGMLEKEKTPTGPTAAVTQRNKDNANDDAPVGTGVATANSSVEFDPFAEIEAEDESATSSTAVAGRPKGVISAIFRAIGKATFPQVDAGAFLPPGTIPGAAAETPAFDSADDPFGDGSDERSIPFEEGEQAEAEDPFDDF